MSLAHIAVAARTLSPIIRSLAEDFAKLKRPTAGTPTLADALRRNSPEMQDFIHELRRQGLLKG